MRAILTLVAIVLIYVAFFGLLGLSVYLTGSLIPLAGLIFLVALPSWTVNTEKK